MSEKGLLIKKPLELRKILKDLITVIDMYRELASANQQLKATKVEIESLQKEKAILDVIFGERDAVVDELEKTHSDLEQAKNETASMIKKAEEIAAVHEKTQNKKNKELDDREADIVARELNQEERQRHIYERSLELDQERKALEVKRAAFAKQVEEAQKTFADG